NWRFDHEPLQEPAAAVGFDLLTRDEHGRVATNRVSDLETARHHGIPFRHPAPYCPQLHTFLPLRRQQSLRIGTVWLWRGWRGTLCRLPEWRRGKTFSDFRNRSRPIDDGCHTLIVVEGHRHFAFAGSDDGDPVDDLSELHDGLAEARTADLATALRRPSTIVFVQHAIERDFVPVEAELAHDVLRLSNSRTELQLIATLQVGWRELRFVDAILIDGNVPVRFGDDDRPGGIRHNFCRDGDSDRHSAQDVPNETAAGRFDSQLGRRDSIRNLLIERAGRQCRSSGVIPTPVPVRPADRAPVEETLV